MNFRIINVIIGREYMTRVKKKSFLLVTFLGPLFFALISVAPALLMTFSKEEAKKIAVVDESGIVLPYLESNQQVKYADFSGYNVDSLKLKLKTKEMEEDVLLYISALNPETKTVNVVSYSQKPLGPELKTSIQNRIDKSVEEYRIKSYQIADLDKIMEDVKSNVAITTYTMDETGNESITSSGVYMAISMILGMIIYLFITMFSSMVMSSVIEEKSNRIVEVLVSSVKSTELMFGKIIGIALVALTQFLLWIVLTGVLVGIGSQFIDMSDMTEAAVQTSSMTGGMDATSMAGLSPETMAQLADSTATETTGGAAVFNTLARLDYPTIILSFLVYFILGYLLYASMFAAVGSAMESETDANAGQLQIPVTIPLLIGFFISLIAFKSPDSPLAVWGSMIPFTSPIVMIARIPFGVPGWQIAVSILLLIATFALFAWLSAKIYRIGILIFGKSASWKDLWRWLKQK